MCRDQISIAALHYDLWIIIVSNDESLAGKTLVRTCKYLTVSFSAWQLKAVTVRSGKSNDVRPTSSLSLRTQFVYESKFCIDVRTILRIRLTSQQEPKKLSRCDGVKCAYINRQSPQSSKPQWNNRLSISAVTDTIFWRARLLTACASLCLRPRLTRQTNSHALRTSTLCRGLRETVP
jgi:hypothetical protein